MCLGGGYRTVWCPFDTSDSRFVKTFQEHGLDVRYGHIETGQDFFDYTEPQGEIVVSNPPFSKKNEILKSLYDMDIPFAIILGYNGIFDNRNRFELFREHGVELLVPQGRMKFEHRYEDDLDGQPPFQSVYVCHKLLDKQITFSDSKF